MSNCLIHAISRYLHQGGYIVIRKSDWGWWPHFAWSADLKTFENYWPIEPKRKRLFPPPLFRGRVVITEKP